MDQGTAPGDKIEGEKALLEVNKDQRSMETRCAPKGGEGAFHQKMIARWHLDPEDPCDDVRDQLRQDLSYLVAYNNVELLNKGLDGTSYEQEVNRLAWKLYKGEAGIPGGGQNFPPPTTNMGVGNDCTLHGAEKIKQKYEKLCVPEVIYDSILKHELTHQRQCRKDPAAFQRDSKTAVGRSRNEMQAYCDGVNILLGWLKDHCGGVDQEQQNLIQNLCR